MRRKIAAIMLGVGALLAVGAFGAGGAQAAQFTCDSYPPCTMTGEQVTKHVFTVQGFKVECTKAHFLDNDLTEANDELTLIPTYEGCTAFGIANAEIDMNACAYVLKAGETTTSPTHFWHGSKYIDCNAEDTITIRAPAVSPICVVHIPTQTPTVPKMDFENKAANNVLITWTVTGIHSNVTDIGGFFCPLSNASTDTTGTYSGTVEFKGTGGNTLSVS